MGESLLPSVEVLPASSKGRRSEPRPSRPTDKGTTIEQDYQTSDLDATMPPPASVRLAIDDIAATMREGLLALAVSDGLGVMTVLMDDSVTAVCGPRGRHQPQRRAVPHGSEDGSVTLG